MPNLKTVAWIAAIALATNFALAQYQARNGGRGPTRAQA